MEPEPTPHDDLAVPLKAGGGSPDQAVGDLTNQDLETDVSPGQDVAGAEPAEIQPAGSSDDPAPRPDDGPNGASEAGPAAARVDLLQAWADDPGDADTTLQAVRVGPSEVALVPFASDTELVRLHYCSEPEIQGYVHCNGVGCALCRAGRAVEERALLPVYQPAALAVGVLPISPSSRPGALRPQVLPVLRAGKRVAILIRKPDRATFKVGTVELREGMDDGAKAIAAFLGRWKAGEISLASVFPRLDNRDLAAIPAIGSMLKLKGLSLDDHDPR